MEEGWKMFSELFSYWLITSKISCHESPIKKGFSMRNVTQISAILGYRKSLKMSELNERLQSWTLLPEDFGIILFCYAVYKVF